MVFLRNLKFNSMKHLLLLILTLSIVGCKNEPEKTKDYVTFSGKIIDKNSDSIVIRNDSYSKTIKVNDEGVFKDTLKVETGIYTFYDGGESTNIYLQNGYDLNMTLDTKMFDETIQYSGRGAETNNYFAKKALMEESLYPPSFFDMEEADFRTKVSEINSKLSSFLEQNKDIDSIVYKNEKENIDGFETEIFSFYSKNKEREIARAKEFESFIGQPSPKFINYENYEGGTTSLADLKGKYVYVDVWATWCGPCIAEIPYLKEVEKQYDGKNIQFVSISVDNGRGYKDQSLEASKEGWRKMIAEKELGGIQLFSDKAWKSDFVTGYKIQGIPRFILIDPRGNVVNADAPRPSSPKLVKLFNEKGI